MVKSSQMPQALHDLKMEVIMKNICALIITIIDQIVGKLLEKHSKVRRKKKSKSSSCKVSISMEIKVRWEDNRWKSIEFLLGWAKTVGVVAFEQSNGLAWVLMQILKRTTLIRVSQSIAGDNTQH